MHHSEDYTVMDDTEIIYEFNVDDFKEFCDSTGGKSPFRYKPAGTAIRTTIIFILTTAVVYFLAFYFEEISFLIFIGALFSILGILYTIFALYGYVRWRKDLHKYVQLMKGRKVTLSVKDGFIKMITDEETIVENLKEIKCTVFRDDSLVLKGESGTIYRFFARSMSQESFKKLKQLIESELPMP